MARHFDCVAVIGRPAKRTAPNWLAWELGSRVDGGISDAPRSPRPGVDCGNHGRGELLYWRMRPPAAVILMD